VKEGGGEKGERSCQMAWPSSGLKAKKRKKGNSSPAPGKHFIIAWQAPASCFPVQFFSGCANTNIYQNLPNVHE